MNGAIVSWGGGTVQQKKYSAALSSPIRVIHFRLLKKNNNIYTAYSLGKSILFRNQTAECSADPFSDRNVNLLKKTGTSMWL